MAHEEDQKAADALIARGYRRTSNKHRMISRIDRQDWLTVMARHLNRARADFYIIGEGRVADKPAANWCDWYRRCLSKDTIESVLPEVFKLIPGSNGDATGYCP